MEYLCNTNVVIDNDNVVLNIKVALATILTQKNYMLWKLVNSFKMMK